MKSSISVKEINEKFIRIEIKDDTNVSELFDMLSSNMVEKIFMVFYIDKIQTRIPFEKPENLEYFIYKFSKSQSYEECVINSSDYSILLAEYVDIYTKDPQKLIKSTLNK